MHFITDEDGKFETTILKTPDNKDLVRTATASIEGYVTNSVDFVLDENPKDIIILLRPDVEYIIIVLTWELDVDIDSYLSRTNYGGKTPLRLDYTVQDKDAKHIVYDDSVAIAELDVDWRSKYFSGSWPPMETTSIYVPDGEVIFTVENWGSSIVDVPFKVEINIPRQSPIVVNRVLPKNTGVAERNRVCRIVNGAVTLLNDPVEHTINLECEIGGNSVSYDFNSTVDDRDILFDHQEAMEGSPTVEYILSNQNVVFSAGSGTAGKSKFVFTQKCGYVGPASVWEFIIKVKETPVPPVPTYDILTSVSIDAGCVSEIICGKTSDDRICYYPGVILNIDSRGSITDLIGKSLTINSLGRNTISFEFIDDLYMYSYYSGNISNKKWYVGVRDVSPLELSEKLISLIYPEHIFDTDSWYDRHFNNLQNLTRYHQFSFDLYTPWIAVSRNSSTASPIENIYVVILDDNGMDLWFNRSDVEGELSYYNWVVTYS